MAKNKKEIKKEVAEAITKQPIEKVKKEVIKEIEEVVKEEVETSEVLEVFKKIQEEEVIDKGVNEAEESSEIIIQEEFKTEEIVSNTIGTDFKKDDIVTESKLEEIVEEKTEILNSIEVIKEQVETKEIKPKRDKFTNPYENKKIKKEELSHSAKKWYDYFKLQFNGKDFLEELLNFKKFKTEKFKFIKELDEIIKYSK
jgi:hypothetical protein